MQDRPTTTELLDAVRAWLEAEVLPELQDERARFRCRVAANLLRIAGRDIASARPLMEAEWRRLNGLFGVLAAPPANDEALRGALTARRHALCAAIRAETAPAGTAPVLAAMLRDQLRIANPAYLEVFEPL